MDVFYYYFGEFASWFCFMFLCIYGGYKLSESVHHYGGWKAWADDFFGLTYDEKGDRK